MTTDRKYPYFQKGLLLPRWKLQPEPAHCVAVDVEEFYLSTDRPPPNLRDQPPAPPTQKPPEPKRPPKSLLEGFLEFKEWLNTPSPPKPAPPPSAPPPKKPRVKPFDLLDIPAAMDRIDWPMSAKVMRKWFAGELNYATSDDNAAKGINQDGKPFPSSMIDTTMFRMDWILQYPRAQEALEKLRDVAIYNSAAKDAIARTFRRQGKPTPYWRDAWKISDGDINRLHRDYQFQLVRVDTEFTDKFFMAVRGSALPNGIFMDDLYGSLGAFSFNAAVGGHRFRALRGNRVCVEIQDVLLYMRDVFTFHDRKDSHLGGLIEGRSQYLGHWNKTGFILVPEAALASEVTKLEWPIFPVARNGMIRDDDVYYPIRNQDYRSWQIKHKQGGDLILYSDVKWVRDLGRHSLWSSIYESNTRLAKAVTEIWSHHIHSYFYSDPLRI